MCRMLFFYANFVLPLLIYCIAGAGVIMYE